MDEVVRLQGTISELRSRVAFLEGEGDRARGGIPERNELELKVIRMQGELEMYKREAEATRKRNRRRRWRLSDSEGDLSDGSDASLDRAVAEVKEGLKLPPILPSASRGKSATPRDTPHQRLLNHKVTRQGGRNQGEIKRRTKRRSRSRG